MSQARRDEELSDLISRTRPPCKELHVIVLRAIFEYVLPPPGLLNPSLAGGPESPWSHATRTLKSLALVCKSWHTAAFPLLYHEVILRRVGQVAALARTIRSSPEVFSPPVQRLVISCEVPAPFLSVTKRSLAYILDQCKNLKAVSFRGTFPTNVLLDVEPSNDLVAAPFTWRDEPPSNICLPAGLMHLGLDDGEMMTYSRPPQFNFEHLVRRVSSNLVSLTICPSKRGTSWSYTPMSLPQLEVLTLVSALGDEFSIPTVWDMPKLKALRLRPSIVQPEFQNLGKLTELCLQHKATLSSLDFGGHLVDWATGRSLLQELRHAQLFTKLEHLVIRADDEGAFEDLKNSPLFSRPIHIDIIHSTSRPTRVSTDLAHYHLGSAWTLVRYIDPKLLRWIPELPYLFPPRENPKAGTRSIFDFYGLTVVEHVLEGSVQVLSIQERAPYVTDVVAERLLPFWQQDADTEDSESDDSDYAPSSSVKSESITSAVQSDIEVNDGGEILQVTETEALKIFARTLELNE